ncbi:uncharacterized protein RB166_000294 [Leptodactylus fuscus]
MYRLELLFLREKWVCESSLILLSSVTGFLLGLWFGGWLFSPSTDTVFLRFLSFQNETYRSIRLLIPWICFCEEWSQAHKKKQRDTTMTETPFSIQCRLLSLSCWIIAASHGKQMIPDYLESQPKCNHGEWQCLFTYINASRSIDWLLLPIGLVLGTTLLYSVTGKRESIIHVIFEEKTSIKELVTPLLLTTGTMVSFYFLPPFITVGSWSILALDSLCGILRSHISQPLTTVCSALEDGQVKG